MGLLDLGVGIMLGFSSFGFAVYVKGLPKMIRARGVGFFLGGSWVRGFAKVGIGMGHYWPVVVGLYLSLSQTVGLNS